MMLRPRSFLVTCSLSAVFTLHTITAFALGEKQYVTFAPDPSSFPVAHGEHVTPLVVDSADWPGVAHAASNLSSDLFAVTGHEPTTLHEVSANQEDVILIGTIGHSAAIDRLIAERKIDVSSIRGRWEMALTQVVDRPFPGIRRALVIAGADKRGTIFGIYDLSEQMGISPWAWWADVPIQHHSDVFFTNGTVLQPEPRVKYRGIFLNDEAPALSGWAHEKFGGFNHEFYTHVFDLLLRLKANFLWPAMWGSAFNEDDPLNPKLADDYGIVMGTSHHEHMMRAQQEWKRHGKGPWDYSTNSAELDEFWREGVRRNKDYEELTTIGMRGDGDMAMSPDTNTALLERIVAEQRKILSEEVNPDVTKVPQVWALYKEVQDYYEKGMRVPDDVTLLWCDDNWGNIRRLPTALERKRAGGAGIYYHFDYVGDPRSYKWLNTYSITKVWEQMNLAVEYGADRMWIVNVGDLKPMEFPIEFFLDMARTPERWQKDNLQEFGELWATREFGPEHAKEIANLVETYTRYNSRRKPEQLEPTTYSLTDDHEADRVDQEWRALASQAERLNSELPEAARPAFFELVLYPIESCATVGEMYIAAGRNRLYAEQGRISANDYADQTRLLFAKDAALSKQYNSLLGGKWNHMMDQTHIGYTFWNEPPVNVIPTVQQVQPLQGAHMAVFPEGLITAQLGLPIFEAGQQQSRTIDIANRGTEPFRYTTEASTPWIHINHASGTVSTDQHILVSIDGSSLPAGLSDGSVVIRHLDAAWDSPVTIMIRARKVAGAVSGFAEANGFVSIEAAHFSANHASEGVKWEEISGFGETLSGMEAFPVTAESTVPPSARACMDYSFFLYDSGARALSSILAPTMSFAPGRGLRYSVAIDGMPPTIVDAWASNTQADWARAVSDGVHRVSTPLGYLATGQHTLQFCRVDPGVVLERLIISHDTTSPTYLGPPESAFFSPASKQ
jgi:hypothetical protein